MLIICVCVAWLSSFTGLDTADFTYSGEWGIDEGCRVRYFVAEDETLPLSPGAYIPTMREKFILENVVWENTVPAIVSGDKKYSEKIFFCYGEEGEEIPLTDFPYFIVSEKGMAIYGRSGKNGCTVRVYSPESENISWETGEDAFETHEKAFQERKRTLSAILRDDSISEKNSNKLVESFFAQKICFFLPERQVPAVDYYYFIASNSGYGIAGFTGEDGCTAELFVPSAELFSVYGGSDAEKMNVQGAGD